MFPDYFNSLISIVTEIAALLRDTIRHLTDNGIHCHYFPSPYGPFYIFWDTTKISDVSKSTMRLRPRKIGL